MVKHLTSPFVFFLITVGDLVGRLLASRLMDYIFKPLLMIWLLGYFFTQLRTKQVPINSFARLIIYALIFSWFGDISLMLADKAAGFFMIGLGNFLIAHLLYIFAYQKSVMQSQNSGFITKQPIWILPFILLGASLYLYMYPYLNELMIPVLIYATVIVLMAIAALNRKGCTSGESFQFVFYGALTFIISDACIAINKFVIPVPQAGFIIMVTYIGAQYLIVQGSLKQLGDTKI